MDFAALFPPALAASIYPVAGWVHRRRKGRFSWEALQSMQVSRKPHTPNR